MTATDTHTHTNVQEGEGDRYDRAGVLSLLSIAMALYTHLPLSAHVYACEPDVCLRFPLLCTFYGARFPLAKEK